MTSTVLIDYARRRTGWVQPEPHLPGRFIGDDAAAAAAAAADGRPVELAPGMVASAGTSNPRNALAALVAATGGRPWQLVPTTR